MEMTILYISVTLIYILFACLDGEDVKPKWKQWLANKLDIKPQAIKLQILLLSINTDLFLLKPKISKEKF